MARSLEDWLNLTPEESEPAVATQPCDGDFPGPTCCLARSTVDLPDVVPLLVYRNIECAHDFLVRAFGFPPGGVDYDDAHYEQARAAGAEIEYEPMDQPYGVREYGAIDPEGHRWAFVTPLE